jgi:hypothetical protein
MSKTIATTIKADVVIYQDGTVEVITDAVPHASGTPAVIKLNDQGAFHCRRAFTPDELASYGLQLHGAGPEMSFWYDTGERLGYDWACATLYRGELDRVADLNIDRNASLEQATLCINSYMVENGHIFEESRLRLLAGWRDGFNIMVCDAFSRVPGFTAAYDRAKALAANTQIEVPTY